MKINELNEGPIDFAKKVGAGISGLAQGGIQGAKAGYEAKKASIEQTAKINAVANKTVQKWAIYNQNVKTSTGQDATGEQATQWLTQFMGGVKPTNPAPDNANPVAINQWLQKEVAAYMAQKEMPQPAVDLPDISQLTKEELLKLKQQLQAA